MSINVVSASFDETEKHLKHEQNDTYSTSFEAPDILETTDYEVNLQAVDDGGNITVYENPLNITVSSIWLKPKTDWQCRYDEHGNYIGDYFEIEDWRRIIGNLIYLKELAYKMYPVFTFLSMGDKKEYGDFPYAYEWNAIEQNIEYLIDNTFQFKITNPKTYYDELPTPNYEDLNRIESTSLQIYEVLKGQYDSLPVLAFTLGGDEFGN